MTDIQHDLENYWGPKIADNMQWSDPVREKEYGDFIGDVKQAVANSTVKEVELQMWRTTREKELNKKKFSRKRLYPETGDLGLTKEDAERAIAAKFQKEQDIEQKKINANFMKMWRMERDEMHAKGVAARKAEKARIKQVKEMTKNRLFIPVELLQPIHDPEAE